MTGEPTQLTSAYCQGDHVSLLSLAWRNAGVRSVISYTSDAHWPTMQLTIPADERKQIQVQPELLELEIGRKLSSTGSNNGV